MTRPTRRTRNAEVGFRGARRSNASHASMTDPEARRFQKSPGAGAMLCFMGHGLMENRHGLIVQADLTRADGHAGRRAAIAMLHRRAAPNGGYAACRPEVPTLRHRRQNPPSPRLRPIVAAPEEDRGTFRLGQNRRRHGADPGSQHRARAGPLHLGDGGLQPREAAKTARRLNRKAATRTASSHNWPHRALLKGDRSSLQTFPADW